MNIIQTPSPNFNYSVFPKIGIQLHKTLGLMPSTLNWLLNPESQSAAHFLIPKVGDSYQLVAVKDRPWTSGRFNNPSARGKRMMARYPEGTKPGEYLIQFEVECLLHETYNKHQIELIVQICEKYYLVLEGWNTLTHQDTASYKPHLEKERLAVLQLYKRRFLLWQQIKYVTRQLITLWKGR